MSRNAPVKTNLPATGQVGTPPPPGAPVEVTQPLQPDAGGIVFADGTRMLPLDRARQNEKELQPLKFEGPAGGGVNRTAGAHTTGGVAEAVGAAQTGQLDPFYDRLIKGGDAALAAVGAGDISEAGKAAAHASGHPGGQPATSGSRILKRRSSMPSPAAGVAVGDGASAPSAGDSAAGDTTAATTAADFHPPDSNDPAAQQTPEELELAQTATALAELQKTHPAASNSDSPARGMPRRAPREGLDIKGGWGDANAGSQYFALSGDELKIVCQQLLRDIDERLDNDMRFSIALTYPRVSVRATLQIHGFAGGPQSFDIERVRPADVPTNDRSPYPQELAEALADEIMFVLISERREVDNDGESVAAPDQLREEFGLPRPGKRPVTGTMGVSKRLTDI